MNKDAMNGLVHYGRHEHLFLLGICGIKFLSYGYVEIY